MAERNIKAAGLSGKLSPDDGQCDGMIIIDFAEDKTAAYLSITQPIDEGRDVTLEDVENELRMQGIVYGINLQHVSDIIEKKQYGKKVCTARGEAPIDGTDGSVKFYFKPSSKLVPREKKYGEVDLRDLGLVTNILSGTPIVKLEPPKDGEDGHDVFGNILPFKPGKEVKYTPGDGTSFNEDESLVIATKDGNLRWSKDRFIIEDTLTIGGNVDLSTGNIEFIGNVIVKGEVCENFTVISKKNIEVKGLVTGATLMADGDVSIGLGSVNSNITAKGNVKLNFCENSKIECDGDFTVQSCMLSEIFCGGVINAISGKGVVVGGRYTALQGFNANTLGSDLFVKTTVTLGNGAVLSEEKLLLQEKITERESDIRKLIQIVELLQEHKHKFGPLPAERETMLASSIRTRFTFQREINQINQKIKLIDKELEENQDLHLVVKNKLWPGVIVKIGTAVKKIHEAYSRSVVRTANGEIEVVPL